MLHLAVLFISGGIAVMSLSPSSKKELVVDVRRTKVLGEDEERTRRYSLCCRRGQRSGLDPTGALLFQQSPSSSFCPPAVLFLCIDEEQIRYYSLGSTQFKL